MKLIHGRDDSPKGDDSATRMQTLLDVRSSEEFATGHATGARNIPLAELATRLGELPSERAIAVYCRSGRRSALAAELLRKSGFSDVRDLGGLDRGRPSG